jgi:hypothetical protein
MMDYFNADAAKHSLSPLVQLANLIDQNLNILR